MKDRDLKLPSGVQVMFTKPDLTKNTAEENQQYFIDTMTALQESMGVPKGGYPRGRNLLVIGGQQCGRSMLSSIPEIATHQVMVFQKQRTPDESGPGIYYAGSEFKLDDLPDAGELMLSVRPRQMGKTATSLALLEFGYVKRIALRNWIRYQLRSKTKKGPKRKYLGRA